MSLPHRSLPQPCYPWSCAFSPYLALFVFLALIIIFIIWYTLIYLFSKSKLDIRLLKKICNPWTYTLKSEIKYVQIIRSVAFYWALDKFRVSEQTSCIQVLISHSRPDVLLQKFIITMRELRVKGGNWPSLSGKGRTWTSVLTPKCLSLYYRCWMNESSSLL